MRLGGRGGIGRRIPLIGDLVNEAALSMMDEATSWRDAMSRAHDDRAVDTRTAPTTGLDAVHQPESTQAARGIAKT
ncbi:MAG: hypothetical protein DCC71_03800 [Proteobacteria bacterium]|nr:MAG: hypothetical protein DCC71_03800 [Pseudomonadota bacterium]